MRDDNKRIAFKNRDAILEKFGNTCSECGSPDRLELHHEDLDPTNNSEDNADVLCRQCHKLLHHALLFIDEKDW